MIEDRGANSVDATVRQLAELDEAHQRKAPALQRLANRSAGVLGRPASVAIVLALIIAWTVGNSAVADLGGRSLEQFPFPDLAVVATVSALLVALLILTAQRHDQALADKRAQLTLQIAMLSERKIAKLIALVEEQRRDSPILTQRLDTEAEELARPANPIDNLRQIEARQKASEAGKTT